MTIQKLMTGRQGANPADSRAFNLRLVFDTVRLQGPISRADLARQTNLTKQTVGVIADDLRATGLLREEGRRTGGIGKPSVQLTVNPDGAFTVGLHLDRDQLTGMLCDLTGQMRLRLQLNAPIATPEVAIVTMVGLVIDLLKQAGIDRKAVFGVGLVMPGPFGVDHVGPTSLPGWDCVALADALGQRLQLPVLLENDATASAIAESRIGVAGGMQNFCLIYLGVGLGVGIVINGLPYTGTTTNAGEFGHLIVDPDGRSCSCGNAGCLERYVSMLALGEAVQGGRVEVAAMTQLRGQLRPTDPHVQNWLAQAAKPLRLGINALENLFDPEAIIFGGDAPAWLLDALIERVLPLLPSVRLRRDQATPRLLRATGYEDMAARGGAIMVLFRKLSPSYQKIGYQKIGARRISG
jgi:predicted NBD/HSP70 family sugar kinase